MLARDKAEALARSLATATRARRVTWDETPLSDAFEADLGPDIVLIRRRPGRDVPVLFELSLRDPDGQVRDTLADDCFSPEDEERSVFADLWRAARASARQADAALDRVLARVQALTG